MPPTDDPRARLLVKFRSVTLERIQRLNQQLQHLEQHPDDDSGVADLMREIHTVKGEAKIMGFAEINHVAHRTEDVLSEVRERGFAALDRATRAQVLDGLDLVTALVESQGALEPAMAKRIAAFLGEVEGDAGEASAPASPAPIEAPAVSVHPASGVSGAIGSAPEISRQPAALDDFVRVSGDQLAVLTALSGDLLVRQDQLDRIISEVAGISHRWQESLQRPAATPGLDAKAHSRLAAMGRELQGTVARARDEAFEHRLHLGRLQDRVLGMRLLDFGALFNRLPRVIRDLAREQAKGVRVRVDGADVAVDKQVLDRLDDPLLHLLRNAVDHGLEGREERRASGKDPDGEIRVEARQVGGHVELRVSDDGRGIDPEQVRAAACARGLVGEDDAARLDQAELLELLFRAGFSTRTQATDISGRGVGLDVVRERIDALGGDVQIDSVPGAGTRFVLRVPISIALTKALVVHCAGGLYALPSTAVEGVRRLPVEEIERAGEGRAVMLEETRVPLIGLANLLDAPAAPRVDEDVACVVILRHAGQRLALEVERFEGEREVVRQELESFLAGVSLLAGTALLGGRRLALFLHLPELYRRAGSGERASSAPEGGAIRRGATILVVDDSELTRVMLVSIVSRLGYEVVEAVDGAEALRAAERAVPDLVMTDLDMPVMNGFELIERLRSAPGLSEVPIIVMSTRGAEADKRRAMEVGANAYVVKTEFEETALQRTFELYLREG